MRKLFGQSLVGWRVSAVISLAAIWTLTAVLWGLLALVLARKHAHGSKLFEGDCGTSSTILMALRGLINVFSTLILVSSNYFRQMLVAPTRRDIDAAHRRSRWMDMGVPSMRNLRFVAGWRAVLWVLMVFSSVPFHLIFNFCVYGTTTTPSWVAVLASESFVEEGAGYYLPGIGLGPPGGVSLGGNEFGVSIPREVEYMAANAASWERLSARECVKAYALWMNVRRRRHVVAVVSTENREGWSTAAKSRGWGVEGVNDTEYSVWFAGIDGLYKDENGSSGYGLGAALNISETNRLGPFTDVSVASAKGRMRGFLDLMAGEWLDEAVGEDENGNWVIPWQVRGEPGGVTLLDETLNIGYCLSEPIVNTCRVRVDEDMFLAVCLVALGKSCLCAVVVGCIWRTRPLATIGDAIDSFVRQPDATTRGMCALGWRDFSKRRGRRWWWWWSRRTPPRREDYGWLAGPRRWERRDVYWGSSVHVSDWVRTMSIGVGGLLLSFLMLNSFVGEVGGWHKAYNWGSFGQDPDNAVFVLRYPSQWLRDLVVGLASSPTGSFFIANCPQLGLSVTGLFLNVIYTRMFMAREWASYSLRPKPLRVSVPKGQQRSESFLEIPLHYAGVMQAVGLLVHWLCANSMYPMVVESLETDEASHMKPILVYVNILLSFKAAITTMAVFFSMLLAPVVLARLRLSRETVLVGSCSAAISAACHVLQPSPSKAADSSVARSSTSPESFSRWHLDESDTYPLNPIGRKNVSAVGAQADDDGRVDDWRAEMAQSELMWGVVSGEGSPATEFDAAGGHDGLQSVGHLAFGTKENNVRTAEDGAYYAGVCEIHW